MKLINLTGMPLRLLLDDGYYDIPVDPDFEVPRTNQGVVLSIAHISLPEGSVLVPYPQEPRAPRRQIPNGFSRPRNAFTVRSSPPHRLHGEVPPPQKDTFYIVNWDVLRVPEVSRRDDVFAPHWVGPAYNHEIDGLSGPSAR